ncbi:mRNA decapping enzyme (Cop-D9R) [Choristoneura biennis entomopoxvirus]|uniref:mRNA decapping enzyme (Cop-D9R) n=1 Tax=Choristoneura biennis entomopoxvirus TaxID=10288 RepID=A0A916KPJ7_CBEPV|nr:mRNA decapping enzyme (Cop-D9R) [Choristoneura biennis entomopoxvirus]CCU55671.1 mRNA decapping enzyme (Cop-D9R) [Choristoneura biennis entomopoxvirus]
MSASETDLLQKHLNSDINMSESDYQIESPSEKRDIFIKNYSTLNIKNYNKKTSFNAILITSDNKVIIAERKFSYYIDTLYVISIQKNISDEILETFIKLFDKLTNREKSIIFNKKKINKKYISIINFIENNFNGNIKEKYLEYSYNNKPRIILNDNFRCRDKFLILPGGKKNSNENINQVILRESHEEINIPLNSTNNINIIQEYYSETIIYDKILSKTFVDVTIIAKIKYSSLQILNFFKPNHEISNIKFIPINNINSMIDLFYYIQRHLIYC